MQPGERTAPSNLEEHRILECVDASQRDRQSTHTRDQLNDRLGELFEPGLADLVWLARRRDDKAQLLEHDVQEMIGVDANTAQVRQLLAEYRQLWLKSVGRDPCNACRVRAVVRPPVRGIVPTVRGRLTPLERVPNAFISNGQSIHVIGRLDWR